MSSTVVSGGEHSEQLTTSKSFKTVHHAFVSSQDVFGLVVVKELFDSVWTKLYNIACTVGISDEVWLDAKFLIVVSGVTPQDVDNQLLLWC